jgi:hypothetical protein
MGKDRRRPGRTVKPSGTRRRAERRRRSDRGDRAFPVLTRVAPLKETLSLHTPVPGSVLVELQLELARGIQAIEELPESYRTAARHLPRRVLSFLKLAALAQGATHPQLTPAERKVCRQEIERLQQQLFPRIMGRPTKDLKDKWLLGDIKAWYAQLRPIVKTLREQRTLLEVRGARHGRDGAVRAAVEAQIARLRESVSAVTESNVGLTDAALDSVLGEPHSSPKKATLALLSAVVGKSPERIARAIFRKEVAVTQPGSSAWKLLNDLRVIEIPPPEAPAEQLRPFVKTIVDRWRSDAPAGANLERLAGQAAAMSSREARSRRTP